ncbi:MAG TPA: response regulator [Polyangiaceae bacterium]|nr:response regulator [Polyangiaceae bacterium]
MTPESERRPRVVLVEEHDDSRETLALALRLAGFDVEAFASPTEALAAIENARPDAVVTSIVLPAMRGDDFARVLRRPAERRPVLVAATGLSDAREEEGELFDRVLVKPIDIDQLADALRRLLEQNLGERA